MLSSSENRDETKRQSITDVINDGAASSGGGIDVVDLQNVEDVDDLVRFLGAKSFFREQKS